MKYLPDIIALSGLCLLGYGLYLFDPRVSFSTCGAILLAYGIAVDILSARKAPGGQ